jgi:hypothetical protein
VEQALERSKSNSRGKETSGQAFSNTVVRNSCNYFSSIHFVPVTVRTNGKEFLHVDNSVQLPSSYHFPHLKRAWQCLSEALMRPQFFTSHRRIHFRTIHELDQPYQSSIHYFYLLPRMDFTWSFEISICIWGLGFASTSEERCHVSCGCHFLSNPLLLAAYLFFFFLSPQVYKET